MLRSLRFALLLVLVQCIELTPVAHAQEDQREPITWDHVYGDKRLSIGTSPPARLTWIDDASWIQRDQDGWKKVNATSGEATAWYDRAKLSKALQTNAGLNEADADKLAAGSWIDLVPDKRIVVFRHDSKLIRITIDGTDCAIVGDLPGEPELGQISPAGDSYAFVREFDLWVADFQSMTVRKLTSGGTTEIRNGKADWIYFEEVYNRSWRAWRWSPDGKKIAFQQFDDTRVPRFQVSSHSTVQQQIEVEHFPKAGEVNPVVRLGIVDVQNQSTQWINTEPYPADDTLLVHFNWLPDSSTVYWFAQNRIQTWLDILFVDPATGVSKRLLRDQTEAWVDNPQDLTFLKDGSFLTFSERSGWRHLYHVLPDGTIRQLTQGEWEVRDLHAVTADESAVIVSGTRCSPVAEAVCRVALNSPSEVTLLTEEPGQHTAVVSPHGAWFADTTSSLTQPPRTILRNGDGHSIRVLTEAARIPNDKYRFGRTEMSPVPMADGSTTQAIFVYPPDFDPAKTYPVWLRTYAGPHSPQVRDAWNPRLADHMLANLGIVVITFDPRSASGYGAKSAWIAYRKLGVEETKDLNSLCDWLARKGWADMKRIGLSGHSYGGFFTSYAMTHCDRICAGIAGAPVTDWANYDTIYTERFMSTPADNPDGYRDSVVASADKLKGRLLLIHGLIDDNVHPENTIQLMQALQNADQQFDVMFYPTSRHGIFGNHYNRLMYEFILKAMGKTRM